MLGRIIYKTWELFVVANYKEKLFPLIYQLKNSSRKPLQERPKNEEEVDFQGLIF
ncbi:hypothetical protein ES702_07318 [subsurface metagenome]